LFGHITARTIVRMTSAVATDLLPVVAAAAAPPQDMVVSIHDVAPSKRETITHMLTDISHKGVRVTSLLVVPDYHHEGLFSEDPKFVGWLRDLEAQGHEVVIHGYYHQRSTRPAETVRDRFVTRLYTRGEGEFYDLDYDEALRRITRAQAQFREAGLHPHGFVAPAWLLSRAAEHAARDAELEYTTRLRTVRDLRSSQTFITRSIVYSVDSEWRRSVSLLWNGFLARVLNNTPLFRVSIHPPDRLYPRIWHQIIDLLSNVKNQRRATTYRDWVAEQRLAQR
jgi:predicted deacetylase